MSLCALLAAACRGSDDGGSGGGDDRLHLFVTSTLAGPQGLQAFDPAAPASSVSVPGIAASDYEFRPLIDTTLDPGARLLRDISVRALALAVGTSVVELDLTPPGSAGATPNVRTLRTFPTDIVDIEATVDQSSLLAATVYTVELAAGAFETFTRTGNVSSVALPFPGTPLVTTANVNDGSITGWLAVDAGMLNFVNRGLVETTLRAAMTAEYIASNDVGDIFLRVDDDFAVYRSTGQIVSVPFAPSGAGPFALGDFAGTAASDLITLSPAGPGSFDVVRVAPGGGLTMVALGLPGVPEVLSVGPNRFAIAYASGGDNITSFALDGTGRVDIELGAVDIALGSFSGPGFQGGRIAYELDGTDVIDVALDGSDRIVHLDRKLAGITLAGALSYGGSAEVGHILLSSAAPGGGRTLESVVPGASPASAIVLGTAAPEFTELGGVGFYADTAVITATDTVAPTSDVYVCRPGSAGSLVRVTSSPGTFDIGLL